MKRSPSLEELIFKRGGIGGAVRRIVFRRKDRFTAGQIRAALYSKHPQLQPAPNQVENVIGHLEHRGIVKVLKIDWTGKTFSLTPRRRRMVKPIQQRFNF